MPQTLEHLAILDLLGVAHGVIALTKADTVDDEWLGLVTEEIRERVAGTVLEGAPIVPVSAAMPNRSAAPLVADTSTSRGVIPPSVTISSASSALRPCSNTPASVPKAIRTPALCAAAMGLSDLIVVGNALLLARRSPAVASRVIPLRPAPGLPSS